MRKTVLEPFTGFGSFDFAVLVRSICLQSIHKLTRSYRNLFDRRVKGSLINLGGFGKPLILRTNCNDAS